MHDALAGEAFSALTRKDQRATAGVDMQGLILDGQRKSMQPDGRPGQGHYQRLSRKPRLLTSL